LLPINALRFAFAKKHFCAKAEIRDSDHDYGVANDVGGFLGSAGVLFEFPGWIAS
jgi:hypothetical protein